MHLAVEEVDSVDEEVVIHVAVVEQEVEMTRVAVGQALAAVVEVPSAVVELASVAREHSSRQYQTH